MFGGYLGLGGLGLGSTVRSMSSHCLHNCLQLKTEGALVLHVMLGMRGQTLQVGTVQLPPARPMSSPAPEHSQSQLNCAPSSNRSSLVVVGALEVKDLPLHHFDQLHRNRSAQRESETDRERQRETERDRERQRETERDKGTLP